VLIVVCRRYIIGLPLFQKNAVEMGKQMMQDSLKHLGPAVIGFELGNEVNLQLLNCQQHAKHTAQAKAAQCFCQLARLAITTTS
jgi:hypothetical protein